MPEQPPLVRQWILLRLLCSRRFGITIREMAAEMHVCEKTIRRDVQTFVEAGFPLEETCIEHGRKVWRMAEPKAPGLCFAFDEAISLYLGRRLMEPLAGTPFWEASQRAMVKIRAVLGEKALAYLERFDELFHHTCPGGGNYAKKAEIIDTLMIGIEDTRAVFLTYRSLRATEAVTYDVYPYGLAYHRGSLYLIGLAPERDDIRTWKVDRVERAALTEFRFQRPASFNLHQRLANSFGIFQGDGEAIAIRVCFDKTVARYASESTWHPSQKNHPAADGSLTAEFLLDSTEEIKRWLLGYGRHVRVLEPAALAESIAREAEQMLAVYRPAAAAAR